MSDKSWPERPLRRTLLLATGLLWLASVSIAAAEPRAAMLPKTYSVECEIDGWWASEKLDGVRGYWDGRQLWSKNGKPFAPPSAFVEDFPPFPLEGELWGGRGRFAETAAIVKQPPGNAGWLQLQFAIFDVPQTPGRFSQRIAVAQGWFVAHPAPHAFVIEQRAVRDRAQLAEELQRVTALGGEGLMVRNPQAFYGTGRSSEILKVKTSQDAEAVVIAHLPGAGENLGRLGALLVERRDGMRFRIGTGFTAAQRDDPPPVGAVITYKFFDSYPSGLPKFPAFLRVRPDHDL